MVARRAYVPRTMTQQSTFIPASDYETVRSAIAYLSAAGPDELDLPRFARAVGKSERQLTDTFRRWCGLSPKSFAQAVALDHAKALLADRESVLDTTYEVGLSSTSRLHDLFVAHEAMPPGVFRARGAGIDMVWGAAPSPFGIAVITMTGYGISGIGFADDEDGVEAAFEDLANRWPNARFTRNDARIAEAATQVFDPTRWDPTRPVRVVLIGTDFEVSVWEADRFTRRGRRRGQEPDLVRRPLPPRRRLDRRPHRLPLGPPPQAGDPGLGEWCQRAGLAVGVPSLAGRVAPLGPKVRSRARVGVAFAHRKNPFPSGERDRLHEPAGSLLRCDVAFGRRVGGAQWAALAFGA
jgi:AraC family transcriptional regulator of adaptative response/methylated-DNA-[protein]-cysteine methyltransferase